MGADLFSVSTHKAGWEILCLELKLSREDNPPQLVSLLLNSTHKEAVGDPVTPPREKERVGGTISTGPGPTLSHNILGRDNILFNDIRATATLNFCGEPPPSRG